VSVDVLDPFRDEMGWRFSPDRTGCTRDTVNGAAYLHEVYAAADPDYTGHVTVPVLWDRERETIVNNESREIMRMLDVAFAGNGVDLYPEGDRDEVDRVLDAVHGPINDGVYRAGFAEDQTAYDAAVDALFDALDHWDAVLADRRYLAGDRLTEADLAVFATLIRFDHVYHTHFKCNRRAVHEYDHLWPYLRDLYTTPGVARTVDLAHVREHYYRTHPNVNPTRIVATGPDLDFAAAHDRDRLPGSPPAALADRSA
jgi:putative glutathione S-transferase